MTEVSGTNNSPNFFQKMGNAFKKGWNNGNLQKGISAAGMSAFTVGFTGAIIHDLNNNRGCSCGGSIWTGMFGQGYNYPMGMNMLGLNSMYMGMMNIGFGMNYMGYPTAYTGIMMPGFTNMTGMPNMGYMNITGGMDPYTYGKMYMQRLNAQNSGNISLDQIAGLNKQDNEYAGKWDENQETKTGENFDKGTSAMIDKDGNAVKGKAIKLSNNESEAQYKSDISNIAKSFAAYIEQNGSGKVDQELTLEEYVNYELSRLPEDATEEEKATVKEKAQIVFSRMDLNQDKKADWKEIGATIATFDTNSDGKQDGKITSKEMEKWSKNLTDYTKSTFSDALIKNYKKLFGSDE